MLSGIDSYCEPATLAEATQALCEGPATLVAGGTLVVREAQAGRFSYAPALINLRHIDEMRGIELSDAGLRIGALTRLRENYGSHGADSEHMQCRRRHQKLDKTGNAKQRETNDQPQIADV